MSWTVLFFILLGYAGLMVTICLGFQEMQDEIDKIKDKLEISDYDYQRPKNK